MSNKMLVWLFVISLCIFNIGYGEANKYFEFDFSNPDWNMTMREYVSVLDSRYVEHKVISGKNGECLSFYGYFFDVPAYIHTCFDEKGKCTKITVEGHGENSFTESMPVAVSFLSVNLRNLPDKVETVNDTYSESYEGSEDYFYYLIDWTEKAIWNSDINNMFVIECTYFVELGVEMEVTEFYDDYYYHVDRELDRSYSDARQHNAEIYIYPR